MYKEMENVTQAVQDELVKSLDYKLGSSNVNYIQSRRDVQYYPSSLSTFTPTTSRVARIPLTSGMDFIDPESLKIAFRVRNNDATLDLNPGTQEPSCFIKRVQLFANGQRCDDISEYGRCCFLYSLLKPAEWYKNKGITGFWELAGLVPAPVPAQNYKDVLMAPTLIGMFQAGKFLPPQLNLVLELEFAEPADALRPGGGSTDYSIENVRVLASQVTLDSALYESYQKILLSGRSLVFAYPTMHTQVSSIPAGSTSRNVTVARAFTKLLGAFVSFRDIDDANLGECSNFEHPGDGSQFSTNPLESQMQLGALQYPRTPMVSDAEHFHFLEILAGTYDSSIKNMRIADNLWNNSQFIAAFPVERVPKHPLSGISTRSGDLARFTFKGMVADRVQRMYIHLLSYQIVTVSGSGSVLDLRDGRSLEPCAAGGSSPDMSKAATMAHPCEHCSKTFRYPSKLQRHVSCVHLKEKPFRCEQCDEAFGTQWTLKQHVRIRHLNDRPHRCDLCGYSCHLAADLKKHLGSHAKRRKLGCPREDRVEAWLEEAGAVFERGVRVDFRDGEEPLFARVDFAVRQPWGTCVLEVDEHQHKLRDPGREERRMRRIRETYAEPVKFIRFNPDEFTVDGQPGQVTADERHRRLLSSLEAPPGDVVYLFYDS